VSPKPSFERTGAIFRRGRTCDQDGRPADKLSIGRRRQFLKVCDRKLAFRPFHRLRVQLRHHGDGDEFCMILDLAANMPVASNRRTDNRLRTMLAKELGRHERNMLDNRGSKKFDGGTRMQFGIEVVGH
jgi:hypothetical protein